MGTAAREFFYEGEPGEVFTAVLDALERIGHVERASERTRTITALVRAGLQRAKLRVAVIPDEGGCLVTVEGSSDDVWGSGARRAADKLVRALD